jgi:site-specific DNA-methyltransferase (adenine-specific)
VGAGGKIMQIVEKSLNELTPYKNNPRKNDNAVDAVAASIKAFGFKVPIVIDKEGVIVCGHTRAKAAKKLKIKTVPCVIADDLTEDEIKAFRLADNKVGELAEWDLPALDVELADIDFDMGEFGFGLLDDEYTKPEEVKEDDFDEEPPAEPKAKRGDIYILGNHRLMCGDSTSAEDVAKLMDGEKADMVFTDPPYNVNYTDKNSFLNLLDKGSHIQEEIENDHLEDDETAKNDLWLPAFKNMFDNCADDSSIYVTMPQGGAHMMMMMSVKEAGWQVKHELIWVKNNHVLGRVDYFYKHEPILFGWKNKHKFYGMGEFNKSVWEIEKPQKSDLHPTMKPIRLIANAIKNSSKEQDCIIDLFGGSGSTLIACEQLNRKCYMMELEPKYVDVIIARWENLTGQKAEKI